LRPLVFFPFFFLSFFLFFLFFFLDSRLGEFCQTLNEIHLDEEEIPTQDTYDYVLQAAANNNNNNQNAIQDATIIFVLDMSGMHRRRAREY
jgi:hypothetical protein